MIQIDAEECRMGNIMAVIICISAGLVRNFDRERVRLDYARYFPGREAVLLYMEGDSIPKYHGRWQLVDWIHHNRPEMPFLKEYSFEELPPFL